MKSYLSVIGEYDEPTSNFLRSLLNTKFQPKQQQVEPCEYMGVSDLAVKCGYYVDPTLRAKLGSYVSKKYTKKNQVKEECRRLVKQNVVVTVKLYPSNDQEVIDLIEIFCESLL